MNNCFLFCKIAIFKHLTFAEYIKPVCIPTTSIELNMNYLGRNATVAGWGRTETRSESNVKLKVDVILFFSLYILIEANL